MTRATNLRWGLLVAANVACWCVLSLQQTDGANPRTIAPSGPTPTQQRAEIIAQLKEIKTDLRQFIQLRQTGALPMPEPAP